MKKKYMNEKILNEIFDNIFLTWWHKVTKIPKFSA